MHEGVSDRRDLDGAGRHRRHRLRLVHRLPLLHGRLPLRRTPLQLGRGGDPEGPGQPEDARARQPPPAARHRGEVHVLVRRRRRTARAGATKLRQARDRRRYRGLERIRRGLRLARRHGGDRAARRARGRPGRLRARAHLRGTLLRHPAGGGRRGRRGDGGDRERAARRQGQGGSACRATSC